MQNYPIGNLITHIRFGVSIDVTFRVVENTRSRHISTHIIGIMITRQNVGGHGKTTQLLLHLDNGAHVGSGSVKNITTDEHTIRLHIQHIVNEKLQRTVSVIGAHIDTLRGG
ncbi:MAG: hypothetical protein DI600_08625 [Cutibacterium granulosum]|nr:MAG: hypothetical protein DI600_08625 [Cutibacterium granulosum]